MAESLIEDGKAHEVPLVSQLKREVDLTLADWNICLFVCLGLFSVSQSLGSSSMYLCWKLYQLCNSFLYFI